MIIIIIIIIIIIVIMIIIIIIIIEISIKIRRFYMIYMCTDILSIKFTNRLQCVSDLLFSTFRLQGFMKDIQPYNKRDISG